MQVLRYLPNKDFTPLYLTVSLGRGGEACIYTVPGEQNLVAKVYHQASIEHARKLEVMIAHPPENPTATLGHISIAWPLEILRSTDGTNRTIGFLMPRIRGMRPIIDFYNPKTRREHCPLFSYQYLLRTARNLAAAFASIHASGYCVGDVNESNIMVSDTALVTIVDTDSFQVLDPENQQAFRCPVGKPEFTPPELQNKIFAQCDRTPAHDLFGLGVLIFQLLMEGTHPFSGIYQGACDPPPYEARIASGHFTYSRKRRVPYTPTPVAPRWEVLHPRLQELFLKCFEDGHENPQLRPDAQTWLLALAEAESALVGCSANPQHTYSNHLDNCPWCERTLRLGGRDPFPSHQAIQAKEHLKPQPKTRKRYKRATEVAKTANTVNYAGNWQPTVLPSTSYYKPPKKPRIYPVIVCLLGFGFLGYLDLMIKLTNRPFDVENNYAQQALVKQQEQVDNKTFEDYYKQGHAAYRIRNFEQAIDNFSKAIQKNPSYTRAYINRGNARFNQKDYEGALGDFNKAIQMDTTEVKAYVNRGNVRYMLAEYSSDPDHEYKLAIQDFNDAIRLNPKEVEAYIRRGIVRAQIAKFSGDSQQDYRRAINDFNEALNVNPRRAEAYFQRGVVRYQIAQYSSEFESEYKQAINDFNEALSINSQLAKVYLKRGIIRYELAQYGGFDSRQFHKEAVQDLRTAAKISLQQDDMDSYQQALNSICIVVENKCDALFPGSGTVPKTN